MTNGDIFKSDMYDEVIRQYDEVAEMIVKMIEITGNEPKELVE